MMRIRMPGYITRVALWGVATLLAGRVVAAEATGVTAPDVLLGDFEGTNYGAWTVTGAAFGSAPQRGNPAFWPYQGERVAYSMIGGDVTVGTLASPEFPIERRYITFLIGGGNHPDETCVNLVVNGRVTRTATGANHEWFRRCLWDVAEFKGRMAHIELVDKHQSNWGHINADAFVQTDEERPSPWTVFEGANSAEAVRLPRYTRETTNGWTVSGGLFGPEAGRMLSREFQVSRRYLHFYFPPFGEMTAVCLRIGGRPVCASAYGAPSSDGWRCWDTGAFTGQVGRFEVVDRHMVDIPQIRELAVFLSDTKLPCSLLVGQFKDPARIAASLPDAPRQYQPGSDTDVREDLSSDYSEAYRPQFHFTVNHGWMNDPNGLVYFEGEYHLFMQHQGWGHAVSPDLVHWVQLENALAADNLGACWSGSAVIDWNNSSGFQTGAEKVMVALYTSYKQIPVNPTESFSRQIQSLAFSNDRGRTWTKYEGNPVIDEQDRDPRMFWHEPTKSWRMVMLQGPPGRAYWSSKDLKHWTKEGTSGFGSECPDLFELAAVGEPSMRKWIAVAGDGSYLIGDFNGRNYIAETDRLVVEYGPNFYATQTFSDIPKQDGRCIQITWMNRGEAYPGTPCSGQQMTFPRELTLRRCPEGLRMYSNPVRELETLHRREHSWKDLPLAPGQNPLKDLTGDLFDVCVELDLGDAAEVGLNVRGEPIRYLVKEGQLTCGGATAPVAAEAHRLKLQILVDRVSLEAFAQDGKATLSAKFMPREKSVPLDLYAAGGTARIVSLRVYELTSIWVPRLPAAAPSHARGKFLQLGPFTPPLADIARVSEDLRVGKIVTQPWTLADGLPLDWHTDKRPDPRLGDDQLAMPRAGKEPEYVLLQSDIVSDRTQSAVVGIATTIVAAAYINGEDVSGQRPVSLHVGTNRLALILLTCGTATLRLFKPGTTERLSDVRFITPPLAGPEAKSYSPPAAGPVTRKVLAGSWRAKFVHKLPRALSIEAPHPDPGMSAEARRYVAADFDDHAWEAVPVPAPMQSYSHEWFGANGEAVFRKTVNIPPQWAGKDLLLSLGPIDDFDDTFFNGVPVGRTDASVYRFFAIPRRYRIPGRLVKAGANLVAVRVFDHFAGGGLLGAPADLYLAPAE